jgi:hypothetical protein
MAASLRTAVEQFFVVTRPEDAVLVIDSTGPMVTRQYLVLDAIGPQRLSRMSQVHSFSGGTFALFVFLGLASGCGRIRGKDIGAPVGERTFRKLHHSAPMPVLRALFNLLLQRPMFPSARPVTDSLEYILSREYTDRRFADMPSNIHLHVAHRKTRQSGVLCQASMSSGDLSALRDTPMREIVAMSVAAPKMYGVSGTSGAVYDGVYAEDHREHIKRICTSGMPTMVSTPWRASGEKGAIRFLRCMPYKHERWIMLRDMTKLLLNVRNSDWGHDVAVAFRD